MSSIWPVFKRKSYLINPRFQISFILILTGFSLTVLTVVYISLMRFFDHYTKNGQGLGLSNKHIFFEFINSQKHFMNRLFLFTSIFLIVFEFIFGLLYSHRICGPLQNMKSFLDHQDPNKTQKLLAFRKTDYFKDLAESFNQFMSRRH